MSIEHKRNSKQGKIDRQVAASFPDKKRGEFNYDQITEYIQVAQRLSQEMQVGQEEATWIPRLEYPNLPILILYMTDIHYGNVGTDYDLLDEHLRLVTDTPNCFCLIGGDTVDNFSAAKHPVAAIMGDAISPQVQTQAMMLKLLELDAMGKIGGICFGNHEDFLNMAGYDFYNTFMKEFHAPIFPTGGKLTVQVCKQTYEIGWSHMHWGRSKMNITNAAKRALNYSTPGCDIILLGHDHQSAGEIFDQAGERVIAIDGGTYKLNEPNGKKWGLGPAGQPGFTLILDSQEKNMNFFRDPQTAQQHLLAFIFKEEQERSQALQR